LEHCSVFDKKASSAGKTFFGKFLSFLMRHKGGKAEILIKKESDEMIHFAQ